MLVSGHACGVVAPALPQVPPHGTLALRAAWWLAISLRSVGSVTSGVPSGVSRSPRKLRHVARSAHTVFGASYRLVVSESFRLVALRSACAPWLRLRWAWGER